MELREHIAKQYNMNVTAWARDFGVTPKTAYGYIKDGAKWINGELYVKKTVDKPWATTQ